MKFSRKIFLAVFLSTLAVGGSILWASYFYVKGQIEDSFVNRYTVFSDVLGSTLTQLDVRTEALMHNAAKFVAERDNEQGLISTEELKRLRDDLNVTHIFIVDSGGNFVRSTNESPDLIPNAFSFCSKYRNLVTGVSNLEATPIIHPEPEPRPFKFLFVPTENRERLVEVGVRVDFIAQTLTRALSSDSSVISLSLYSPKGQSFGRFYADKTEFSREMIALPESFPMWLEKDGHYEFFTKVKASHTQCCQCDVSKASINGEYYYVLRSKISKGEIAAALAATGWAFLILSGAIVMLAFVMGRLLSRNLVTNIVRAKERIRSIKSSGSLKARINLDGNDEVAFLTNEFDRMLDSLEESQEKVVEAERVEAKVRVAREVAHNIRSPIVAIEMMLPGLPETHKKLKRVLRISVAEIKSLSERLAEQSRSLAASMASQSAESDVVFIPTLVEDVVAQKQFEYSGQPRISFAFENQCDPSSAFFEFDPVEFRSVLSNILNNSVEALEDQSGEVRVCCFGHQNGLVLEVIDNGVGIPGDCLNRLGREPITIKGGRHRGIGLVHAFNFFRRLQAPVSITSTVGLGTVVRIELKSELASRRAEDVPGG